MPLIIDTIRRPARGGMKIDHSTFIVERFPIYQALLRRDRRNHRIRQLTRWAMYAAAFALGAWIAATTGGAQ